ncbi:MAG: CARDB domain-containing protein [Alphaproteobacteria bacterium]|nr:CARDB domain-containing protein [Alphaproteobacteria bacterium]
MLAHNRLCIPAFLLSGIFAVFVPLTGDALAAEPFPVGPGSRVCIGNTGDASSSSNDPTESAATFFEQFTVTKAGANGKFLKEHSATAEVGILFKPLIDFEASMTVFPQYSGVLGGGGPAATNKANFRLDLILRDVTEGVDLDSDKIDDIEQTSGSKTVVQDLFDPPSGTVSAAFQHDHEYEVVIRLSVKAKGAGTKADFFTDFKGARYACIDFATTLADSDGDGLYDEWETTGIDVDGDGQVDLAPDQLGLDYRGEPITLDPNKKDVLVEIDYFDCAAGGDCADGDQHTHRPQDEALDRVREVFAAAPVSNPGDEGINLWIVRDQALPHREFCNLDATCFDQIKPDNFGASDTGDPLKVAARRLIFHYSLWVHKIGDPDNPTTILGVGEVPGNDTLISLGGWTGDSGSVFEQAVTFMHELGHNLGLQHGGSDERNCKPNHLSIMSYTWAATGLLTEPGELEGVIDYSRKALPESGTLKESNLDESIGIQDGGFITFYGPPADLDGINQGGEDTPIEDDWHVGEGSGPIDWDQDGATSETPADPTDINFLGIPGCGASPGESLHGHDDWANLIYNFRATDNFLLGIHQVADETFDFETAQRVRERVWWSGLEELYEYSGKLVCGVQGDSDKFSLTRGGYATTINVHNPNRKPVTFYHKLALSLPGRDKVERRIYPLGFARLDYDEALKADCDDVREALFPDGLPEGFIEGFLVVQSPRSLDVVGVYTTAALAENGKPARHSSIDVEPVPERRTQLARPDLVIRKVDINTRCGSAITCSVSGGFEVANVGTADASPFQVSIRLQPGEKVIATVAVEQNLGPNESVTKNFDGQFAQPDLTDGSEICVAADLPADVVDERREDNNETCVAVSLTP